MEKALLLSPKLAVEDPTAWDRLYVGHEFCQRLLPDEQTLNQFGEQKPDGLSMTLVTPYVTDEGLAAVENLVRRYLVEKPLFDEVVFNDWGVFRRLRQYGGKRVLGRLLVRQLRDPRVLSRAHMAKGEVAVAGDLAINEDFQDFLLENDIKRIELDTLPENIDAIANRFRVSLYRPFTYVTTTRLCPLADLADRPERISQIAATCSRECLDGGFLLTNKLMDRDLYLFGNALFFENPWTNQTDALAGIDRVIEQRQP